MDYSSRHKPHHRAKTHVGTAIKTHQENDDVGAKSFANFLIQSEVRPLVFVGRCLQYFGLGAVVGFLLGGVGVYGYAMFRPLPYAHQASVISLSPKLPDAGPGQPEEVKTRWLHGVVTNEDDIQIAVIENIQGPFPNGTFSLKVPTRDKYQLTLWNPGYHKFKVVDVIPDANGQIGKLNFGAPMTAELRGTKTKDVGTTANRARDEQASQADHSVARVDQRRR